MSPPSTVSSSCSVEDACDGWWRLRLLVARVARPGLHNWWLVVGVATLAKLLLAPLAAPLEPGEAARGPEGDWGSLLSTTGPPLLLSLAFLAMAVLLALRVELLLAAGRLTWEHALKVHAASLSLLMALPALALRPQCTEQGFAVSFLITISHIILFLKLVSYVQVNMELRRVKLEAKKNDPNNNNNVEQLPVRLGLCDLLYFLACPTLSYPVKLAAPRGEEDRPGAARQLLELGLGGGLAWGLGLRLVRALSAEVLAALAGRHYGLLLERFLALSVVTSVVWMVSFYVIFYSCLNLLAGVLGFADRSFYLDWWSAPTIEQFWRRWNLPVHRWCSVHLYRPLVRAGWSKLSSSLLVFLASATLHEYLFSVPLRLLGSAAFVGMAAQPLLVVASRRLVASSGDLVGNLALWIVLIFGNSIGVVVYHHHFSSLGYCTS